MRAHLHGGLGSSVMDAPVPAAVAGVGLERSLLEVKLSVPQPRPGLYIAGNQACVTVVGGGRVVDVAVAGTPEHASGRLAD
jgi:hypothetical protein